MEHAVGTVRGEVVQPIPRGSNIAASKPRWWACKAPEVSFTRLARKGLCRSADLLKQLQDGTARLRR